jgi:hypothetical protein
MAPVSTPVTNQRPFWRLALVALIVAAAATMVACRPATILQLDLDLRSYLPDDATSLDAQVPVAQALRIYLLPGIQVDDISAGPDEDMRTGSLLSIPSAQALTEAEPTLAIEATIRIENTGDSEAVPETTVTVRLGPEASTDIYADGSAAAIATSGAVEPGTGSLVAVTAVIDSSHPAFALLLSGSFRIGVSVEMDPNALQTVPVRIDIVSLRATVTLRPFGFIQSGVLP